MPMYIKSEKITCLAFLWSLLLGLGFHILR